MSLVEAVTKSCWVQGDLGVRETLPLDGEWQSSKRMNGTGNIALAILETLVCHTLFFILFLKSDLNISYHIFGAHVSGTLYSLNLSFTPILQSRSHYPFYRSGNWGLKKLTNLPKDTELANGTVKLQSQAWQTPNPILFPTDPIWFPMGMSHSFNERKVWQGKARVVETG